MERFSEKSLQALGDFYVYGLIDPRTNQFFYIGKGTGNRVFEHEKESLNCQDSEKLKLKTIEEIKAQGLDVMKIIIKCNLTEKEAFAAEASLIAAFDCINGLTNIVSGHHSTGAMSVEQFELENGAAELKREDIKHNILVIKINKLYRRDMPQDELYDAVRGLWRASLDKVEEVDYVFGVYNSLIVGVYKPSKWYVAIEEKDKLPKQDEFLIPKTENRVFFEDEDFELRKPMDEDQEFYLGRSIAGLEEIQRAQNPITYLKPFQVEKLINQLFRKSFIYRYL